MVIHEKVQHKGLEFAIIERGCVPYHDGLRLLCAKQYERYPSPLELASLVSDPEGGSDVVKHIGWMWEGCYTNAVWKQDDEMLTLYENVGHEQDISKAKHVTIPVAGFPSSEWIAPAIRGISYARIPDALSKVLWGYDVERLPGSFEKKLQLPPNDGKVYPIVCFNPQDPEECDSFGESLGFDYEKVGFCSRVAAGVVGVRVSPLLSTLP